MGPQQRPNTERVTCPLFPMNDQQLKTTLLETCPVLPGQEARAWNLLEARLEGRTRPSLPFLPSGWRFLLGGAVAVSCAIALVVHFDSPAIAPVFASSQSPGIFATAFYSRGAHAQVVWLNGMDPATDGPTYMDPTSKIDESAPATPPPDSL
jgi:hypothetical protein